ncbi:MAG: CCA tRNA nucleotidyltransferase [Candidatus Zixiibacteriota bacterium]
MKILLPKNIQILLMQIIEDGHTLYAVGGMVRDAILDRHTKDFDLITNSNIEDLIDYIPGKYNINHHYGILNFKIGDYDIEIARMRCDSCYSGRHSNVEFIDNIEEDLKRRDFTVNALAVKLFDGELIDLFGGLEDIKNSLLRTIGEPKIRFEQDVFRIIRAISFATRLDFDIEENTKAAIKHLSDSVKALSPGLVGKELQNIIQNPNRDNLGPILKDCNLFEHLFGYTKKFCAQEILDLGKNDSVCYLLYNSNIGAEKIGDILLKYQFPRNERQEITRLYRAILSIDNWKSYDDFEIFHSIRHFDFARLEKLCKALNIDTSNIMQIFPGIHIPSFITGDDILKWVGYENKRKIGHLYDLIEYNRYKSKVVGLQDAKRLVLEEIPKTNTNH